MKVTFVCSMSEPDMSDIFIDADMMLLNRPEYVQDMSLQMLIKLEKTA